MTMQQRKGSGWRVGLDWTLVLSLKAAWRRRSQVPLWVREARRVEPSPHLPLQPRGPQGPGSSMASKRWSTDLWMGGMTDSTPWVWREDYLTFSGGGQGGVQNLVCRCIRCAETICHNFVSSARSGVGGCLLCSFQCFLAWIPDQVQVSCSPLTICLQYGLDRDSWVTPTSPRLHSQSPHCIHLQSLTFRPVTSRTYQHLCTNARQHSVPVQYEFGETSNGRFRAKSSNSINGSWPLNWNDSLNCAIS